MDVVYIYLLIINALGFLLMLADKQKAKKNLWRIPESTLMTVALIGGSIGSLCGMHAFRHKTRHPKFFIGIPVILVCQIAAVIAILFFIK